MNPTSNQTVNPIRSGFSLEPESSLFSPPPPWSPDITIAPNWSRDSSLVPCRLFSAAAAKKIQLLGVHPATPRPGALLPSPPLEERHTSHYGFLPGLIPLCPPHPSQRPGLFESLEHTCALAVCSTQNALLPDRYFHQSSGRGV